MANILKEFLGDALDGLILTTAKYIEKQEKLEKEEKRRRELREGSIDVEFKIKTEEQKLMDKGN